MDSNIETFAQWQKIGTGPHHGIALPLMALRNPTSCGTGEYLDLIPLITWCKSVGFDCIQLLPLNDSGHDTSPYSAHTAMGLHPIYLTLRDLPDVDEELPTQLNDLKRVDYHKVYESKMAFLRKYFKKVFLQVSEKPEYKKFVQEQTWLRGYSLYKALKDKYSDRPWWEWAEIEPTNSLFEQYRQEIDFYSFLQYLCFDQMAKVKEFAALNGVFIKGDIPILINRDSADVWLHKRLFLLDLSAGAPPDMFSEEGQHWGFPLYNWDEMEKEDYQFWRTRLQIAQNFYHLYRVDHIVGFFKIWAIPAKKTAKEGYFLPQEEAAWIPQGEKILKIMLRSSSMLPIGEDLGAVPPSVRECMQRLGIPGTKVLRWERRWEGDQGFIDPKSYHPLSMSTLSTHDSDTLAEWWAKFPQEASIFAATFGLPDSAQLDKEQRKAILTLCHQSGSRFHINLLQEYLAMFDELSWKDPKDDRINIPGLVLDRNWTYRFKPTIQDIISHPGLSRLLSALK